MRPWQGEQRYARYRLSIRLRPVPRVILTEHGRIAVALGQRGLRNLAAFFRPEELCGRFQESGLQRTA